MNLRISILNLLLFSHLRPRIALTSVFFIRTIKKMGRPQGLSGLWHWPYYSYIQEMLKGVVKKKVLPWVAVLW